MSIGRNNNNSLDRLVSENSVGDAPKNNNDVRLDMSIGISLFIEKKFIEKEREVNLREFVDNRLDLFFAELGAYFNTNKKLPLNGLSTAVHLNNFLLSHLLKELVDNAVDAVLFVDNPSVNILARVDNDILKISITDNGKGIDESLLKQAEDGQLESSKKGDVFLGGAGAGLKQVISSLATQSGALHIANNNSKTGNQKCGATVDLFLPVSAILTHEQYEVQVKLRAQNKLKFFRFAHLGKYAPPEEAQDQIFNKCSMTGGND